MDAAGDDSGKLLEQGLAAFQGGRLDEAERLLRAVLRNRPQTPRAHGLLARIHLRREEFDKAGEHARLAIGLAPGQLAHRDVLAKALAGGGRAEGALDEFREACKTNPGDSGAAYGLGVLLLAMGRNDEAAEALGRARELAPHMPVIRHRMAGACLLAGRHEECLELVQGLIAGGDNTAALHDMAGRCHFQLGNPRAAAHAYEQAIALDGRNREYPVALSAACHMMGRGADAERITAEFLRRFPSLTLAAKKPEASVLVLSSIGARCYTHPLSAPHMHGLGNFIGQIPAERFTFHYFQIEHPEALEAARRIAPVDLVYNNVATAETAERFGYGPLIRKIVDDLGVPVVNAPEPTALTTRRINAARIPAALDMRFPNTRRYDLSDGDLNAVADAIRDAFLFPLILRGVDTHSDQNMPLIESADALSDALTALARKRVNDVYAIEYLGMPYEPGVFRKLRCALIGGKFYPSHVSFSDHWNVHRRPADLNFLKTRPDLMDEEKLFVQNPERYIGAGNIARL
ncbi:MAG: tetratricopeptide repeat protein, partial [Rhodospirillales bacterium]|nr:tetratricopeptide repeat protein [Rhodospirillales bacterium]